LHAERELADLLLAPSELARACLVENGVEPERIALVPYGVDIKRFAPVSERDDRIFRVLFVGGSWRLKGLRYLVEAWRRLALPRAELLVVGGSDGNERSILERCPSCTWLGQIPRSVVHECFARSDVFVLPSLSESFGLVVGEAMASALPVVATPNCGSIVRDGVDGLIVAPRDVDALCKAIEHLYRHPDLRREMGARARRNVEINYTWSRYADRLVAAYDSLFA
jgi:glycosyltransferase involved in cell wall biosynthesis